MPAIQNNAPEIALTRFARQAMATSFEFVLPWEKLNPDRIATAGFDLIEELEAQLTVFRTTSEVSRLNRIGAQAPVPVEQGLFELLQLAQRINRDTDGAFDITSGPLIKVWGFFKRQGRIPDEGELAEARTFVGLDHLTLDAERLTVRFARNGMEINLGSIGKGYALD